MSHFHDGWCFSSNVLSVFAPIVLWGFLTPMCEHFQAQSTYFSFQNHNLVGLCFFKISLCWRRSFKKHFFQRVTQRSWQYADRFGAMIDYILNIIRMTPPRLITVSSFMALKQSLPWTRKVVGSNVQTLEMEPNASLLQRNKQLILNHSVCHNTSACCDTFFYTCFW